MSELNLILLGPPGAGKGTQAERLVEDFPVVVVNDLYGGDLYKEGRERWRR